jgi:hypothetical protein
MPTFRNTDCIQPNLLLVWDGTSEATTEAAPALSRLLVGRAVATGLTAVALIGVNVGLSFALASFFLCSCFDDFFDPSCSLDVAPWSVTSSFVLPPFAGLSAGIKDDKRCAVVWEVKIDGIVTLDVSP